MSYSLLIQRLSVIHDKTLNYLAALFLPNASCFLLSVEVLSKIIYCMFKWVWY